MKKIVHKIQEKQTNSNVDEQMTHGIDECVSLGIASIKLAIYSMMLVLND